MREALLATEATLNLTVNGTIAAHCRGFELVFGYGHGEVIGRECSFLFPPEDVIGWSKLLESAAAAVVRDQALTMLRKDGSKIGVYLSICAVPSPDFAVSSFLCMFVTRGRPALPETLSGEFKRIFRHSNDAVMLTGRDGVILDVNPAFCGIYGYGPEEICGRNPRVLKSGHSRKEMYESMWADILDPGKGFWSGELVDLAKDGREIAVLISINAVKDGDGDARYFLGIARDISRRKELDGIRYMRIDSLMHDIRGPLTTITINSELLLMQIDGVSEKTRRKINMILESARKIRDMSANALDYCRAPSGALPPAAEKAGAARISGQAGLFDGPGKKPS